MTVKDASAATGISPRTIRAHIHKGTLPAVQLINGRYDIRSKDLYEWHVWMYRTSRATMFPSWRSEKFVRDFGLCERQKQNEYNDFWKYLRDNLRFRKSGRQRSESQNQLHGQRGQEGGCVGGRYQEAAAECQCQAE